MLDQKSTEIAFALETVRQASLLVQRIQAELVSTALTAEYSQSTAYSQSKEDRSPVTVADFASQALIGYCLSKAFPGDPLIAEEDSATLRDQAGRETLEKVTRFMRHFVSQATPNEVCNWIDHARVDSANRFWTVDPIDGTKGFLRGDQYAVALALVVDGEVQIGVLGCPKLVDAHHPDSNGPGSLVIAARNQGTWTTPLASPGPFERLRVSSQSNPEQARVLRSFESGHTNVNQVEDFSLALGIQAEAVRMDSQAKYAVLAAGKGELLLRLLSPSQPDYREKIWDQVAGSIILEEAGGCITDLDGKALDFRVGRVLSQNRGILASNGALHQSALQALQTIAA